MIPSRRLFPIVGLRRAEGGTPGIPLQEHDDKSVYLATRRTDLDNSHIGAANSTGGINSRCNRHIASIVSVHLKTLINR